MNSRVRNSKCQNRCTVVRPLGMGILFGGVSTLLVIFIASVIFSIIKSFACNLAIPCAIAAAAFGAFIGGFTAARIFKCRGLFLGIAVGFLLFAVVWLAGIICGSELFTTAVLAQLILMVLSGALGGFWAVNSR